MQIKKAIKTFSFLSSCFFLLSIQGCSEKSQKDASYQVDILPPKITTLDTALIDSSSLLPAKQFKKNEEVDPDRPHTLNGSN
jgi:hypothetical protein